MIANWMLTDTRFYDEIAKVEDFAHTEHSGYDVSEVMHHNRHTRSIVRVFKPWWWRSKSNGYSNSDSDIFINGYRIKYNSIWDYVGFLVHEWTHQLGYHHDGNYKERNDNINSVPYVIGAIGKKFAMENYSDKLQT